jgi:hypothetical protein
MMLRMNRTALLLIVLMLLCMLPACRTPEARRAGPWLTKPTGAVRFATFNASLSRDQPGELAEAMRSGDDRKARKIAEILQRVRPDVLLVNEFDFDPTGQSAQDFQRNYLAVSQNGAMTIEYPYVYAPRVNTGEPTGADLNADGQSRGPQDAHGWGDYPGHYGMLVLSMYPLDLSNARALRLVQWADLPGNVMPHDFFSEDARRTLRLSSKTHADIPVQLPDGVTAHLVISHPTPPVFDGPEDRNGRRNHDEIALLLQYLDGSDTLRDDAGEPLFGLDQPFVILGDLNADPYDGDSYQRAVSRLLAHPQIQPTPTPSSRGAIEAAQQQAGINRQHHGDPAFDTADFPEGKNAPGNLRVDYVLPSREFTIVGNGVFWPESSDPLAHLIDASDHRLVWVDAVVSE